MKLPPTGSTPCASKGAASATPFTRREKNPPGPSESVDCVDGAVGDENQSAPPPLPNIDAKTRRPGLVANRSSKTISCGSFEMERPAERLIAVRESRMGMQTLARAAERSAIACCAVAERECLAAMIWRLAKLAVSASAPREGSTATRPLKVWVWGRAGEVIR